MISVQQTTVAKMTLRMMEMSVLLKRYLCRGEIESQIYYLTSLGSLQIMQKIRAKAAAADEPLQPEESPQGHLAKNFGALSIHRREDWAVTVKGFNHLSGIKSRPVLKTCSDFTRVTELCSSLIVKTT